jgi:hypothetical protein
VALGVDADRSDRAAGADEVEGQARGLGAANGLDGGVGSPASSCPITVPASRPVSTPR